MSGVKPSVVVSHAAVIHGMYGYCALHGFRNSLKALQQESLVPFTTIPPPHAPRDGSSSGGGGGLKGLEKAVMGGDWASVLIDYTDSLTLSKDTAFALYERVVLELAEHYANASAAKIILTQSPVLHKLRREQPTRFQRIESVVMAAVEHQHRLVSTRGDALAALRAPDDVAISQRAAVWALLASELHEEPYDVGAASLVGGLATQAIAFPSSRKETTGASAMAAPFPLNAAVAIAVPGASFAASFANSDGVVVDAIGSMRGTLHLLPQGAAGPTVLGSDVGVSVSCITVEYASAPSASPATSSGVRLLVGLRSGAIKIYDVAAMPGKLLRHFTAGTAHSGGIATVVAKPPCAAKDEAASGGFTDVLLSVAHGENAKLLSIGAGAVTAELMECDCRATCASIAASGDRIFAGREDGSFLEWSLVGGSTRGVITAATSLGEGSPHPVLAIAPAALNACAVVSRSGSVYVFFRTDATQPFARPPVAVLRDSVGQNVGCIAAVIPRAVAIRASSLASSTRAETSGSSSDSGAMEAVARSHQWACYTLSTDRTLRTFDLSAAIEDAARASGEGDDHDNAARAEGESPHAKRQRRRRERHYLGTPVSAIVVPPAAVDTPAAVGGAADGQVQFTGRLSSGCLPACGGRRVWSVVDLSGSTLTRFE